MAVRRTAGVRGLFEPLDRLKTGTTKPKQQVPQPSECAAVLLPHQHFGERPDDPRADRAAEAIEGLHTLVINRVQVQRDVTRQRSGGERVDR